MKVGEWRFYKRPSFFGKRKSMVFADLDKKFGVGRWRIVWKWGEQVLEWLMAVQIYEDAYYHFLRDDPAFTNTLVQGASEVYDNAESNVQSGIDYTVQETPATHLQDISVRRCLIRLGRVFEGSELIQIRSNSRSTIGKSLSPGRVPFHLPEMIEQPPKQGWWERGTVEEFYQSNKIIQTKTVRLDDF